MAYTTINFKTKKVLKEAVAKYKEAMEFWSGPTNMSSYKAYDVKAFQPGLGPDLSNYTGKVCLEGPHYPAAHTWHAEAEMKNGKVIKVK